MTLHSKQKGSIGELKVATALMELGFAVFTELGDLSRVDLIVLVETKPYKIQVKAATSKDGHVTVYGVKSGPGYHFRYKEDDVDIFAIYVLDQDIVFFVTAAELLKNQRTLSFRLVPRKKGQQEGARSVHEYTDFLGVLRGHELYAQPDQAEGDDMVQTTTGETGQGNLE